MKDGGDFNLEDIAQFNGGLFDGRPPLRLEHTEIGLLFAAASLDWSLIDPTIFGTLFERFLDPDKRAQIGAHYTDPDKIMMIVEPVVARPLQREWETAKAEIEAIMAPALRRRRAAARRRARTSPSASRPRAPRPRRSATPSSTGCARLRILDPACGSGNFLYLALAGGQGHRIPRDPRMRDARPRHGRAARRPGDSARHRDQPVRRRTRAHDDLDRRHPMAGEERHHPPPPADPAQARHDRMPRRAADADGWEQEADWPEADFIIGNPPFLGGKLMRRGLGRRLCERCFAAYAGKVPAEADFVCYWFDKAWSAIMTRGATQRVGLVATNSIRGGANRKVLEPIAEADAIFEAWSDEPWMWRARRCGCRWSALACRASLSVGWRARHRSNQRRPHGATFNLIEAVGSRKMLASRSWVEERWGL